jgi:DNA-binding GntR family transcriptional regulator
LISACNSPWLHRLNTILYQQSERYRRISLANRDSTRDIHAEHKAIYDAVLARDAERASQLTAKHIDSTLDVVRQVLARDPALAGNATPAKCVRMKRPAKPRGDPAANP